MSNFETEYKKYAQDSTPDLWDRIEAGVDAYEASASQDVTKEDSPRIVSEVSKEDSPIIMPEVSKEDSPIIMPEVSKEAKSDSQQEIERKTGKAIPFTESVGKSVRKSFKKSGIRKYAGLIAAAACLLIATPAIVYIVNNSGGYNSAAPTAEAPMFAEPMDAAVAEEAVPDMAYEGASEAVAYEETSEDNMACEEVAEADVAYEDNATFDMAEAPAEVKGLMTEEEPVSDGVNGMAATGAMAKDEKAEASEVTEEAAVEEVAEESESLQGGWESLDGSECAIRAMWNEEAGSEKGELITLDKNMPSTRVHLFIDEKIDDFKIMRISIYDFSEEGKVLYNSEDVYKGGTMKAGDELVLKLSFPGDTPPYAISYTDSKGNEKAYGIEQSGKDGSVILSEL